TLKATDSLGLSATQTVDVTVNEVQPSVTLTAPFPTNTAGNWAVGAGVRVTVSATVSDPGEGDVGPGTTYAWSVTRNGDPFASDSSPGLFTFLPAEPGTYVVTLNVTDRDGAQQVSGTFDVASLPTAALVRDFGTGVIQGAPAFVQVGSWLYFAVNDDV